MSAVSRRGSAADHTAASRSASGAPSSLPAFDVFTPPPAPDQVRQTFAQLEVAKGSEAAVRYLYGLALSSGYVRTRDIARNICWTARGTCGDLELTINLSKPEKDPRAIAAAAWDDNTCAVRASDPAVCRPRCDLCWENECYPGDPDRPAKPGLRIAAIELGGEPWGLQFSPYAYFEEHCIALSREHRPMKVDAAAVVRLLDFVDRFPFYFVGSNADLPIVGGSILAHDHYQGGRHVFPLMKAPVERPFALAGYPDVAVGMVAWPASTVRLQSCDRTRLEFAAAHVLEVWRHYDDPACGIVSSSAPGVPHNTANPIARKLPDGTYVLDLILRNNRTSPESPWGVFHPGEHLHHIKRENIGLIEAMGMAILPPRLARELPVVRRTLYQAVCGGQTSDDARGVLLSDSATATHASWAAEVLARRGADLRFEAREWANGSSGSLDFADAPGLDDCLGRVLREEVACTFDQVLESVGVFKRDAQGLAARERFIGCLT